MRLFALFALNFMNRRTYIRIIAVKNVSAVVYCHMYDGKNMEQA